MNKELLKEYLISNVDNFRGIDFLINDAKLVDPETLEVEALIFNFSQGHRAYAKVKVNDFYEWLDVEEN